MTLSINQIDTFFDQLNVDKTDILKDLKSNNLDGRSYRALNIKLNIINNLQLNLLKLRKSLTPDIN